MKGNTLCQYGKRVPSTTGVAFKPVSSLLDTRLGVRTLLSDSLVGQPALESSTISFCSLGTISVTMNTGFFAELSNTERLSDCRFPGVLRGELLHGDIRSELLLLATGDLNDKVNIETTFI